MLLRQSRCSAGPCDQSHVAQLTASCSPLASSPAAFFFTSCSTVTASPRFWKQSHRPVSSLVSTQRLTRDETARVSRGSLSLTAHGFVALRLSLTHRFGCVDRVLPVIPFDQAVHRRFGNAGEPLEEQRSLQASMLFVALRFLATLQGARVGPNLGIGATTELAIDPRAHLCWGENRDPVAHLPGLVDCVQAQRTSDPSPAHLWHSCDSINAREPCMQEQ